MNNNVGDPKEAEIAYEFGQNIVRTVINKNVGAMARVKNLSYASWLSYHPRLAHIAIHWAALIIRHWVTIVTSLPCPINE